MKTIDSSDYPDELNPFADAYPQELNPFEGEIGTADESSVKVQQGSPSPKRVTSDPPAYPQELNPSESAPEILDDSPTSAPELLLSASKLDVEFGAPLALTQLLTTYLRTHGNGSIGDRTNSNHLKKLAKDISTPPLSNFLTLKSEEGKDSVTWKEPPANEREFQSLLQAFKALHKGKGSFYTLLTNFDFPGAGYRLLDDAAHDRIIRKAAKPAMHRPGKGEVVDMKRKVMSDVLKHFSDPQRHDQPLPEGAVDDLISHYGRTEKDLDQARSSALAVAQKSGLSLNDRGFVDAVRRFFHRVKTGERVDRFNNEVAEAGRVFQKKMLGNLDRIHQQHAPKAVASRTKQMLDQRLKQAQGDYAQQMKGRNIYPEAMNAESARQIDAKTEENFHKVLRGTVLAYEGEFVADMTEAVTSFSVDDYFKGKSLERSVDNIIHINRNLSDLYQVAQTHHESDISEVEKRFGKKAVEGISEGFETLQLDFAKSIRKKVLENYRDVLNRHHEKLDEREPAEGMDGKLELSKNLVKYSANAIADLNKVRNLSHDVHLKLEKNDLEQVVLPVAESLKIGVDRLLPKRMTTQDTLKLALKRSFKPTKAKILIGGGAALVGTLLFIASPPLGFAALAGASVAALAWSGRNIYRSFGEAKELNELHQQVEQQWREFGGGMNPENRATIK
ncbi:hypothetical protein ACMGT0_01165 [Pseudomonas sp. RHF3.3-3]|uniref:hypothetical protein n=1 Tax=Pseudomonas sp. RHF3.3-3 TaxID=3396624 RepID=UPI003A870180